MAEAERDGVPGAGIAGAAPEAMGEPYEDAAGRRHARLLGQPISCLPRSGGTARAWRVAWSGN